MKKNLFIFLGLFLLILVIYLIFCKKEYETFHYFLPLSNSILQGNIDIKGYDYLNELVTREGKSYVVYPPMPAIALLPFALIFGMSVSQVYPHIIIAALAGAIFYFVLKRLTKDHVALALTFLLVFGTNFFMTSMLGRSWYFAHICAVFFMSLALFFSLEKKPFWAGLFYVAAGMSRLPMLLALPAILYFLHPKGKDYAKFFSPVGVILAGFAVYNMARFGSFTQTGYSLIPGVLDEPWFSEGIFSLSYIPRNLEALFLFLPKFSSHFPFMSFDTYGLAIWVTTPVLLLLGFFLKNRRTLIMIICSLLVLMPGLTHGTVGFSQFGYRFSLDAILLLLIALIPAVEKWPRLSYFLIGLSIAINLYAVILWRIGLFKL